MCARWKGALEAKKAEVAKVRTVIEREAGRQAAEIMAD